MSPSPQRHTWTQLPLGARHWGSVHSSALLNNLQWPPRGPQDRVGAASWALKVLPDTVLGHLPALPPLASSCPAYSRSDHSLSSLINEQVWSTLQAPGWGGGLYMAKHIPAHSHAELCRFFTDSLALPGTSFSLFQGASSNMLLCISLICFPQHSVDTSMIVFYLLLYLYIYLLIFSPTRT